MMRRRWLCPGWLLAACALLALSGIESAQADTRPHRIASLNLCTDEMLVRLAAPDDIASLSPMIYDEAVSRASGLAGRFINNGGSAEEIVRERADLVLTGPYSARATVNLLRRLGYKVVQIPIVQSLAEVAPAVRALAAAIGQEAAGDAWIESLETTLAAVRVPEHPPSALIYEANGYSIGAGTLANDVLKAAGYANQATLLGLKGYAPLALETVVAHPPDILMTALYRPEQASLAERWLDHPALDHLPSRHLILPTAALVCGTPEIAGLVTWLAAQHPAIVASAPP